MVTTNDFLAGVLGGDKNAPLAAFEPQRMNSAKLRINLAGSYGADAILTLAIANFPLPKVQTNINAIAYLNELRKFAGNTMQEDMNVSFHDYVDRGVSTILWKWHYDIQNPVNGTKRAKSVYAKTGEIEAFAPDAIGGGRGEGETAYHSVFYDVYNIWPAMLDLGDIDYNSDEPVRINVHFAVDKIVPRGLTGASASGAPTGTSF